MNSDVTSVDVYDLFDFSSPPKVQNHSSAHENIVHRMDSAAVQQCNVLTYTMAGEPVTAYAKSLIVDTSLKCAEYFLEKDFWSDSVEKTPEGQPLPT